MTTDYFRYAALASPMGTPEHTPPGHPIMSKSSSRARTHRNFSTKSAPLPSFETSDKQEANANAAFDAKRLTSTLQASLVSEILTLRRDLDSKHVFIENLEESLKTAHNETENMSDRLRESNKKTRQLEHKIKQLENATFDAVQGLLYERDTLEATNKDLRKKLDAANKDIKSMGEQNVRSRESWDNHKQSWQKEKRQLEQKVHVSDVRVRTLVEELRTRQEVSPVQHEFGDAAEDRHVLDNDSYQHHGHYRNESNLSMRSLASSIVSLPPKSGMTSLANELDSDEDDYDTEVPEEDEDDEDLPLFAGNRCSTHSKASAISNRKAKTVLGFLEKPNTKLSIDIDRGRSNPGEIVKTPSFTERLGLQMAKINFRTSDSDKASSRSVSPVVTPKHREEHIDQSLHVLSLGETAGPIRPKAIDQGTQSDWSNMEPIETPISLPNTPWHLSCEDNWLQEKPIYTSASTQTEVAVTSDLALRRHASMISVETHLVPAIKIQPPLSPRGGDTVLPPGMRSVSVQTEAVVTTPMLDVGVQTIFRIPTKPWPHLMASALENSDDKENVTTGRHGVHATSRHGGMMHRSTFSKDGNRLPLIPLNIPPPRLQSTSSRSHQQSGTKIANDLAKWSPQWQVGSSASDSSRFNASSKGSDKQQSHHERMRMGSDDSSIQSRPSSSRGTGYSGKAGPFFASNQHGLSRPASNKETLPPPFPIPGRISSRPQSREGDQSPFAPPFVRSRRPARDSRIAPAGGLRKVQSSGGMRTNTRRSPRQRRKTPDLEPIQSMVFDTQSENLLFLNSEKQGRGNLASPNEDQPVYNPPDFDQDSAVEEEDETSEDNVIVDAIAGTMVGEWMWKYTRRRRSFGLGEFRDQPDDGVTSGVRHKRWVWLSPYEHTIMWSAKQPNSGPALLGKAGRTLIIKSVLDMKDTTPLHKGASHEPVFDRSILIVTPDRALKLTAINRERHYLWLTALSFLAESGLGPPRVPRIPPAPEALQESTNWSRRTPMMPVNRLPSARPPIGMASPPAIPARSHQRIGTADSTAPPNISKLNVGRHQRKRSNSNPLLPSMGGKNSEFARRASNTAAPRPSFETQSSRSSIRGSERTSSTRTVCMDAFTGQRRGDDHSSRHHGNSTPMTESSFTFDNGSEVDPFEEF